jgi:choline-glycine betaine transporter
MRMNLVQPATPVCLSHLELGKCRADRFKGMHLSLFGNFEVTALETLILTLLTVAAPCLIVFILFTFATITILKTYREDNHDSNIAAFHGHRRVARVRSDTVATCTPV